MNIDEALKRARHATAVERHSQTDQEAYEAGAQLMSAFEFIDGWMSTGGELPTEWNRPNPVVVIVEHPQADPSVFAHGPVTVFELSTYPLSNFFVKDGNDVSDLVPVAEAFEKAARKAEEWDDGGPVTAGILRKWQADTEELIANPPTHWGVSSLDD